MLGDMSTNINNPRDIVDGSNPQKRPPCLVAKFQQGVKQRDYLFHKAEILSNFISTPPKEVANGGYGTSIYRVSSLSTPALDFLVPLCYKHMSGRYVKTITTQWLDLLGLEAMAYWIMDDGSVSSGTIYLSTHGFTEPEVDLLVDWLTKIGLRSTKYATTVKKTYYFVALYREAARLLMHEIAPLIHPTLAYKTNIHYLKEVQCSCCGQALTRKRAIFPACDKPACRIHAKLLTKQRLLNKSK
jgi:hypothetical protein